MAMHEDKEYQAIGKIVEALGSLDVEQRSRVLKYAAGRFAIGEMAPEVHSQHSTAPNPPLEVSTSSGARADSGQRHIDIRELKDTKQPKSGTQMAVLVAYYLKTLTTEEQKDAISSEDIVHYFNQAGFPLPTGKNGPTDTLNNAKKAGYLESVGKGKFRLNPVGYNLAAYKMPSSEAAAKPAPRTKHAKKKVGKKK